MSSLSAQRRLLAAAHAQSSRIPVASVMVAASVALATIMSSSAKDTIDETTDRTGNTSTEEKEPAVCQLKLKKKSNFDLRAKVFAASMVHDLRPPQILSGSVPAKKITLAETRTEQKRTIQHRRTLKRMDSSATRKSIYALYDIESTPLGEGSFGQVFAATDKRSGESLALKKIRKEFTDELKFQKEMNALLHVRACGGHPNICMLREHFEEKENFILILDLIRGGEMFEHLIAHGAYSEADAARLTLEVASALSFLHGIGVVHTDLKPENLMLSSINDLDAVIKVVDFGSAEVLPEEWSEGPPLDGGDGSGEEIVQRILMAPTRGLAKGKSSGTTPAYCPPEALSEDVIVRPSWDMWSLGVILYIMLTGVHPFDVNGDLTDEQLVESIKKAGGPPLHGAPHTAHLSPSAIDLLSRLMSIDPTKRLTAHEMLEHPWVLGKTAKRDIMAGSDRRLSRFRRFRSRITAKVFADLVNFSNGDDDQLHPSERGKSLMEKAFTKLDKEKKGFITLEDVAAAGLVEDETSTESTNTDNETHDDDTSHSSLSLSGFSELVGENLQSKFFPRGHVIFHEGDLGDYMYFINSGTVEVSTKDGFRAKLGQGDSFGAGSLIRPGALRSATIRCITPLHVIRIDKAYFNKYVASSETEIAFKLREKVNKNNFGRAEFILGKQSNLTDVYFDKGDCIFKKGEDADSMYTVDEGEVDVRVAGMTVYTLKSGDTFGVQGLLMGRPRRASAFCVSDHCKLRSMDVDDFKRLLESSPELKQSLREMALRREFRRAMVLKTRKAFPDVHELKAVFDEVDLNGSGDICVYELKEVLRHLEKSLSDDEILELIRSMDLNNSGSINFSEFQSIFGRN